MNIIRRLLGFLDDNPNSLRLEATRKRLSKYDIEYLTITDGKRAMRNDMLNLYGDFNRVVKLTSAYRKES